MTSIPPPGLRSSSESSSVRGMTAFGALGWAFFATFVMALLASLSASIRGSDDILAGSVSLVVAYSFVLFVIMRTYAKDVSIRSFIGLRPTAAASYPLAFVAGLALSNPANKLYELILRVVPSTHEDSFAKAVSELSDARLALLTAMITIAVPFVEEVIFRGALYTPLRKLAERGSVFGFPGFAAEAEQGDAPADSTRNVPDRALSPEQKSFGALHAAVITSVLFVMVHMNFQGSLPLALAAASVAFLRVRTGSLLPPILFHAGFNAAPFAIEYVAPERTVIPWSWAGIGAVVAAASLFVVWLITRGGLASVARAEEL